MIKAIILILLVGLSFGGSADLAAHWTNADPAYVLMFEAEISWTDLNPGSKITIKRIDTPKDTSPAIISLSCTIAFTGDIKVKGTIDSLVWDTMSLNTSVGSVFEFRLPVGKFEGDLAGQIMVDGKNYALVHIM